MTSFHSEGGGCTLPHQTSSEVDLKPPEDHVREGSWECEPFYYSYSGSSITGHSNGLCTSSNGRRIKRGKAYRNLESGDFAAFEAHDGTVYRPGDCVYMESFQPELPYFICGIQSFKMTKREQLNVLVKWYYRPSEVPECVWHTLVQDRHTENSERGTNGITALGIENTTIQYREVFISDAQDICSVSTLRGKCRLKHFKDIAAAACSFEAENDTFFYILGYNPENNRLASIQGEIRVGPSHQAKLPELRAKSEWSLSDEENEKSRETLVWRPDMVADSDLKMFLQAARSMAAFAGISDSGSADDGYLAAARDATTINALKTLHGQKYDKTAALQDLVRNPVPLSADQRWSEEDKGECIEFYYLWKKSPAAGNQRPRQRIRRPQTTILRRIKSSAVVGNAKPSRPASSEFLDFSSASENEFDSSEDSVDNRVDLPGYACHHCYATTSKDWHHAGKDRALLCRDCRLYFKKYGELRSIVDRPRTPPPYLFKPVKDELFGDYIPGVRTRGRSSASKDLPVVTFSVGNLAANVGVGGKKRPMTPTAEMESSRKSPSAASVTSSTSCESEPTTASQAPPTLAKKGPKKGRRRRSRKGPAKRPRKSPEEVENEREERESPEESSSSRSPSVPSSPKLLSAPGTAEIVGSTIDQAIARVTATIMGSSTESDELSTPTTNSDDLRNTASVYEFQDDPLTESIGQYKKQITEMAQGP